MVATVVPPVQPSRIQARAAYVRVSAYKAREILNLIRGRSYAEAHEILTFSERAVARRINKILESAAANAEHNNGIDRDELYVSVCYADEGPTLKRWRPRARGRATPIRKRTCHITIIVDRYDSEQLDAIRARSRGPATTTSTTSRRRRVARSRKQQDADASGADATAADAGGADAGEAVGTEDADATAADAGGADAGEAVGTEDADAGGADAGEVTDASATEASTSEDVSEASTDEAGYPDQKSGDSAAEATRKER